MAKQTNYIFGGDFMDTTLTQVKKEIVTFLIVTFSITFSMGILMFFVYKGMSLSRTYLANH